MKREKSQLFLVLSLSITLALGALAYGGRAKAGESSRNPVPNRSASLNSECTKTCQNIYRKRIETCDTLYPPASRSKEHTECLKKAKSEFDDCMATCK